MDLLSCESFGVSSYVSAPTSPGRANLSSSVYFYSLPTSPTCGQKDVPFDLESEPGDQLKTSTALISSSDSEDGFEFRTSQQQQKKKKKKKEEKCGREDPCTMMAFADELFCNGQVLPLKPPPHKPPVDEFFHNSEVPPVLKLPPRLQQVDRISSSGSSPRSPSSLLRWPLLCWNLKNEEFDPFMAALEHVMKEERGREVVTSSTQKLTKSLSSPNTSSPRLSHGSIPEGEPTEVSRLVSASLVGYSRSCHGGGCISKPNFTTTLSAAPKENNTGESLDKFMTRVINGGSYHKGSAKNRIKNFIFRRSSFEGWVGKKEKLRDHQTAVLRKSHFIRRFSFKSIYANLQCKERSI